MVACHSMSQHVPTPGNCFGIVPFPFACALASRAAGKRSGGKYGAGAPLPAFFAFIKFPGVKLLWMATLQSRRWRRYRLSAVPHSTPDCPTLPDIIGRSLYLVDSIMAVRVRFELTEPVKVQRFSRPPDSTTLAPHRACRLLSLYQFSFGF